MWLYGVLITKEVNISWEGAQYYRDWGRKRMSSNSQIKMLNLLSQSWVLCTDVTDSAEWSLVMQCDWYLKFYFTFCKLSKGSRWYCYRYYSIYLKSPSLKFFCYLFQHFSLFLSSLFLYRVVCIFFSQYIHVKMTVKFFCSPQDVVTDNYN